jgi:DNA-binding MarR family transcriptional regulator
VPIRRLSPAEWASIVDLYELGQKNQRQLAEHFGVSGAAIHKGLKKRGAIKGCRVQDNLALIDLNKELDARWRAKRAADDAAFERMNERTALIAALTEMLLDADRKGTLTRLDSSFRNLRRVL